MHVKRTFVIGFVVCFQPQRLLGLRVQCVGLLGRLLLLLLLIPSHSPRPRPGPSPSPGSNRRGNKV